MGSTFSEDASRSDYPTSGKPITVKVQCSHNGKCLSISEHRGARLTSDWTCAQLQETIEVLAGVHRHCQRLMFGGRMLDPKVKIVSMLGCGQDNVPERIKLFLIVDRHKFPQSFGPFNVINVPLELNQFDLPPMTEEFKRSGFYWDMSPKVLETHGLQARSKQLTAQVSPAHPVDTIQQRSAPKGSTDFVWSYPVAGWEGVESDAYALDRWELGLQGGAAVKSFLSVGGFMYLDSSGGVSKVSTLGRPEHDDVGALHFAEPRMWCHEWTAALAEMGRFQKITLKSVRDTGARMYMWLRPQEVIEGADGNPFPLQPDAPHGAFVYLFHDDILSTDEVEIALDRYFAVVPAPSAQTVADTTGLFRALTLVDGDHYVGAIGGPPIDCETFCHEEEDSDGDVASFMMSTPGTTPMALIAGTPSSMSSPMTLRSSMWSTGLGHSAMGASPEHPFHDHRQLGRDNGKPL
mmetsp:Transcript_111388/g.311315  ORF Transcript_111388/g.311315 Transcript_111388/m.311315 type:complete len:463 (+) Transcript_111388:133-1521(+)|eukprot:CAMPEP_0176206592 /NCGR_PEP_ID=MMETSP0121_2-20121125/12186_1 /TAXON_ID=160619 /ORGANISM="Kryptoperidinium foliaceum, Strain CCMP 1326" /LENGTH=462 /DNA_ID=CAMNT_0017545555 /DNA_START=116 /DNA_END=1504 /DNA_ORIENTATION=-